MRSIIYKIALVAVIVCVLTVLVAPDFDLPAGTVLRVKDGFRLVVATIQLCVCLLSLVIVVFAMLTEQRSIRACPGGPSHPFLCTFLC